MRLLKRLPGDDFELNTFDDDDPPPYAILSHTWGDQEVSYQELVSGEGKDKTGFGKIRFCGERAAADGLEYFWVDTCCIDKTNLIELSTAINYMFRWYQRTSKCYVYLSDVSVSEDVDVQDYPIVWAQAFRRSRWFTRGWTLQELIAPGIVEFYSKEEKWLGSKISLEQDINQVTKIPVGILRGQNLQAASIEERISWAACRKTTLKEDKVYCLLGIFGVFLPLIYGEGEVHAKRRLQDEIRKEQEGQGTGQKHTAGKSVRPLCSVRADCVWSLEKVETTRPALVMPFPRDPDFVDRGTLLNELQGKSSTPASRVALVGLGGVGKSQLAIEYCYRAIEKSPELSLFWVHASNAARFEQSFRNIADSVKIEGREEPRGNVFKLVHDWLRDGKNPWLLVLDNVDDASFLLHTSTSNQEPRANDSGATTQPLREYLPYSDHGSIIITSRNKEAALKLVEQRGIVSVEPMAETQAVMLLQKKLEPQQSSSDLADLAAALDFMPLAISQAAAYITQRAPRCSVVKYLDSFRKSERKRLSLLSHDEVQLRRDWEAKNSIIVTWQISFQHIQQTRSSAADLLSLMSFFDPQEIPEALLRRRSENKYDDQDSDAEDIASQSSLGERFERDVVTLRNFHFISIDTAGTSFEMHALVQLATKKWITTHDKLEYWKEQFVKNLCAHFPTTGEFENWKACQPLSAHVKLAAEQMPENHSSQLDWASLLYRAAWYARERGNYAEAITWGRKCMGVETNARGQEHKNSLRIMAIVASTYESCGFWEDAEELQVRVMEVKKEKLGSDHLETLDSMLSLATTYQSQGRWNNAEELQVQVMETYKKKLGADHPDRLGCMNNLAGTYYKQGRYAEAEQLQVQVMKMSEQNFGLEYPNTWTSMDNLAITYGSQGRYADAEKILVQVVEFRRKELGADHPNTLTSMESLAGMYYEQGRCAYAEELEVQVLEMRKQKLGADHPVTLSSMNNLAFTYKALDRKAEAIELMKECNKLGQRVLRADHPYLIDSLATQARWEAEDENQ